MDHNTTQDDNTTQPPKLIEAHEADGRVESVPGVAPSPALSIEKVDPVLIEAHETDGKTDAVEAPAEGSMSHRSKVIEPLPSATAHIDSARLNEVVTPDEPIPAPAAEPVIASKPEPKPESIVEIIPGAIVAAPAPRASVSVAEKTVESPTEPTGPMEPARPDAQPEGAKPETPTINPGEIFVDANGNIING